MTIPRLDIRRGAKLAFVGESGSGKSTLLELLAMLLRPSASSDFYFQPQHDGDALDITAAWHAENPDIMAALRSRHIGYVLQYGGLLPYLTVRENIELSRQLLGMPLGEVAAHWAGKLDITAQLAKRPAELSVGQRQRVAIARALAHDPSVLIADEPTAAVDPPNAERIMNVMVGLVDEMGVTLIVASHAHRLMRDAGIRLIDHQIAAENDNLMHVTVSDATS